MRLVEYLTTIVNVEHFPTMADSNTSDGTADELPAVSDEPTTPDPTDANDEQSQPEATDEDDEDEEEDEDEDEEDQKSGNEEAQVEDKPAGQTQAENSITFQQGDNVPITKIASKEDAETALIYISSDIIKKVKINDQKTIVSAVE